MNDTLWRTKCLHNIDMGCVDWSSTLENWMTCNRSNLFFAFTELEKACDEADMEGLLVVVDTFGLGGGIWKAAH